MKTEEPTGWGWLPALCVTASVGLLVVALADRAGINGEPLAEPLFWLGILIILTPFAIRLLTGDAARRERIGLVVVLGLALYLVKYMHSPYAFTFSDELIHVSNADQTLTTNHLFNRNLILQITPLYPGLQSVVAALAALGGLSPFDAGIVVIGAARLILVLSLFLFFEEISGSARIAGLASLLYMLNANFLFWLSQLSYQTLALSLAALFLFIVSRRANVQDRSHRLAFDAIALIILGAVVITHHLTTYALVGFLWLFTLLFKFTSKGEQKSPWILAVIASVITLAWVGTVARLTLTYLLPLFGDAFASAVRFLTGQESGRELFRSTTGYLAPLWERITGIGSIAVILAGMPAGLLYTWRKYRHNPFALALGLLAPTYFALLLLRFTGAGWEIANRSSMFLFIAIAFVLAVGIVELRLPEQAGVFVGAGASRLKSPYGGAAAAVLAGLVAFAFVGGVIAGWPPNDRLPRPYVVSADSQLLEPPGVLAARWTKAFLGAGNRIASDGSNARLLQAYGQQRPVTGDDLEIRQMLTARLVDKSVTDTIHYHGIAYLLFDRRRVSGDHMIGTFFDRKSEVADGTIALFDPAVYQKFDLVDNVNRLFDGGNIVIYDVRGLDGSE